MATTARSRLDVDERRTQLLELGLELFGLQSPEEVSIDEIAKAAGISKGLLYHYFGSKREYWVETVRFASDELLAYTDEGEPEESDDELAQLEGLHRGLNRYLDFIAERADGYLTLMKSGTSDPQVYEILNSARETFAGRIFNGLGLEEPTPMARLALASWIGAVEAACVHWLSTREVTQDELRGLLVSKLLIAIVMAGVPLGPGSRQLLANLAAED